MTFTMILATFILIIAFFYWFALALGPLIVGFVVAATFYRATGPPSHGHSLTSSPRDQTPRLNPTIPRLRTIWRNFNGSHNCPRLRQTI